MAEYSDDSDYERKKRKKNKKVKEEPESGNFFISVFFTSRLTSSNFVYRLRLGRTKTKEKVEKTEKRKEGAPCEGGADRLTPGQKTQIHIKWGEKRAKS